MIRKWLARGLRRLARLIEGPPSNEFTIVIEGGDLFDLSNPDTEGSLRRALDDLRRRGD